MSIKISAKYDPSRQGRRDGVETNQQKHYTRKLLKNKKEKVHCTCSVAFFVNVCVCVFVFLSYHLILIINIFIIKFIIILLLFYSKAICTKQKRIYRILRGWFVK